MNSVKSILNRGSYGSKLGTPEWREFSRAIRKDRNFCECCKMGDRGTQVHHLFYDFEREPWEYSGDEVVVLCSSCHKELHERLQDFRKYVFKFLNPNLFKILNGCLAVGLTHYDPLVYMHALAEFTGNEPLVRSHAKQWGINATKT